MVSATVLNFKSMHQNFFAKSAKNEQISIIFGVQNPQDISHRKIINSLTSSE